MAPYQTIFFDIDDTLIDFKKSEEISLIKCHDHFFKDIAGFELFCSDYKRINLALWKLAEENKIPPSAIARERFKQLLEFYKLPQNAEIAPFYGEQLIQNSTWIEGAQPLLADLKERGVKIAFLTNGLTNMQKEKYQKLNLGDYSEILVISDEFGYSKPHPHIFLHALDLSNAEVAQTLMVGDSLSSDGEGARNVGMPFCWYNPSGAQSHPDWQPDFTISKLSSLIDAIDVSH